MILPQFGGAHNLVYFNFFPKLNIDCFLELSKGISYVVPIERQYPCKLFSFSSNSSSCRRISMVYSGTLKTSFSRLVQYRLDLTTENLWILFGGHYTVIGQETCLERFKSL